MSKGIPVSLINDVLVLCQQLSDEWADLLKAHGLNIRHSSASDLADELLQKDLHVDRTIAGFADFASDVARGIVPRRPAYSLLYHALASPNVVTGAKGVPLHSFPTLDDIELLENYVFGVAPPSLEELCEANGKRPLAVVVFAYEYRPASQTCHRKHADLVFSRTGIARVGTQQGRYVPALRGYVPDSDVDPFAIHVSPARYAAFLSVRRPGSRLAFLPMRFRAKRYKDEDQSPREWKPDNERKFWVPVHKLFCGKECLKAKGLSLSLACTASHVNEKLFRLHATLGKAPRNEPPYRIWDDDIAKVVVSTLGSVTVLPTPHDRLVEEAMLSKDKRLTFTVPNNTRMFDTLSTSLEFAGTSAPAYVHVRTEIRNEEAINLNEDDTTLHTDKALLQKVINGGYEAQNYVDFTGEGWVKIVCPELKSMAAVEPECHAAYSLVTAPDFYPGCDQRELTEWTGSLSILKALRDKIWSVPPRTLCDTRISPNLQLPRNPFTKEKNPFTREETITALVSLLGPVPGGTDISSPASVRHSHLPDDAAGEFAPGWDVSHDKLNRTWHLAAYALGSPFPEDAKLCAALSTFWPAVAPDATREMEPYKWTNPAGAVDQSGTVSPMTDQEIAQVGDLPWDGVKGPRVVTEHGQRFVEYASFHRVDYVRNALAGLFTLRLTARIDAPEYQQRVLAMALAYATLHFERKKEPLKGTELPKWRTSWKVLSFQAVPHGTPELVQAQQDAGIVLLGDVYRIHIFQQAKVQDSPDFRRKRVPLTNLFFFFVDPGSQLVLIREETERKWKKGNPAFTRL